MSEEKSKIWTQFLHVGANKPADNAQVTMIWHENPATCGAPSRLIGNLSPMDHHDIL